MVDVAAERSIFLTALEKACPEARAAYLQEACGGDLVLRSEVEKLLAAHERLDGNHRELDAGGTERPGSVIGPYKLLEQIGEGGFGIVFMAEQQQPIRRKVALKVLKPGMDTRQVIARFEAERQALAMMDHPNISRVHDGGETASGRPYFVMELVRGAPITEHCDRQHLSVHQRLELFVHVCHAVQHAHQKGIIHRDIKPSNILVTLHDGAPVVKVIDFGVAKAMGQQLTERTLFTNFAQMIGTPLYMSPEQAEMSGLDIDTRADIYALGVLLYELLTGTTPFDRERLQTAGFDEIRRVIREEEPAKPSTRISTMGAALSTVSENRQIDPRRLRGMLRGELDWIVMKCLEKDRTRRYETANGLARDIQRYLDVEPVEAGPPSAAYKVRKFARKHRKLLSAAGLVALLLIVASVVSIWQAVRATRAEHRAIAQMDRADEEADIAQAVNDFLQNDLLGQADIQKQPARTQRNKDITVRELLDRAAQRIAGKFEGKARTEAAILYTLGAAYEGLGEYGDALKHLERSRQLSEQTMGTGHPQTLRTMTKLGLHYRSRGRYDDARVIFEKVVAHRREQLSEDHLDTLRSTQNLGQIYRDLGRYDDAEPLLSRGLELYQAKYGPDHGSTLLAMNNLALLHLHRGRFLEAEPLLKHVVPRLEGGEGPDHPYTLTCKSNLAGCYMELRRFDDAEPLYRQVLEVSTATAGTDHPNTLFAMKSLALAVDARGGHEEAEAMLREVLKGRRAKLDPDHPDTLTSLGDLAGVLSRLKKYSEAEALIKQALEGRLTKLGADHPDTLRSMNQLGTLYRDTRRYAEAEPLLRDAVEGAKKKLGPNHPQTQLYIKNLAEIESKLRSENPQEKSV